MALIRLEQVWKTYALGAARVAALRAVDLEIEAGEFVAVWGPSGSGKTTLCNLVGAVDTPTSGRVWFEGRETGGLTDDARSDHRNRSIGFIFQRFNLVPVLDSLENVMLPLSLRGEGDRAARARAAGLLEELGLAEFMGQRPDRLSGGQQQRVAIARALVTSPRVVIADEPTANLDSENAARIVGLMREANRARGTTFIFSTHDQRLLAQVRRRVQLRDGTVVADEVCA